ncbi:NDP-sugar epimerase, includes UDP-GlcNAc-inverting 4,6-dehydratase FlaA1 and capsular polysaccharide biosynthesis protein EpsC [Caminicella sporogenes DSM 14501]|uniref:NDP-sugar epimerase, includes UDP-GlcNAc-inverting 4,6-dehydratase FlaA1 and capsular polysaccharide biosynthesis protein EpsC n=1 Tax=Caminicella sporogenes DSM 14501 TaxID=1121266 RepID=A0A1M6SXE7_9FIRM|nr:nucleoside-diphosphate sugar epimerase/dehydratase [Caminicella sporogenes]RKD21931.1 nucleoside-diphosphate sugar epimerase [Caminicella sporogenes]SHK49339.1 NDP-sugar epimerase, includes UDP-GlcNAc-inverting 4,6-dehydratase FlaA1 and capsular polysaccharide biosynthesis protein EpsC [Caminicella sporogenes DSM 14501]
MKKKLKNILLIFVDVLAINLSFLIAFAIRFDGNLMGKLASQYVPIYLHNALTLTLIKIVIFYMFKMYNSLWRYASIEELIQIISTSFFATAGSVSYMFIMQNHLPRSIYILTFILDIIFIGAVRFSYRILDKIKEKSILKRTKFKRVMIVGAGQAGAMVIKELKNHDELQSKPIAVIDDDETKLGKLINGVPVLGDRYHIKKIAEKKKIDEIIIAIPSASKREIKEIIEECSKTKCKLKILPGVFELIDGKVSVKEIRDVNIEDLLGREPVKVNLEEMSHYLKGKVVLVTGGGGSIGSELCRQISNFKPKKLLILDIYENNAYDIQNELKRSYPKLNLEVLIASIRDRKRIEEIFEVYKPNVVFHAAAHKHVPLMEANPQEAIKNNVFGTLNVAECADKYGSEKFVLISTDKAVNPTNVMGATKRMAEMIVQAMSKKSKTEFVAVRFGNVLGSNGSVIPLFKKQIANGGPVTVTHPEVTRYFMTIPEAVQLVIQAGAMAKGGEIFVLDMGEPVKIVDLAENLIRLSGFEPYKDIDIQFIGLRPGEKLYEELLMDEEGLKETQHNKIFIGKPLYIDYKVLEAQLRRLKELIEGDREELISHIQHMVPTYKRIS